ncbi:helix-turn-helix domain-containing protein [Fictibacillus barbaricus]|uniref:HTH psq-type domain-containing protein n=1 Tax=Fictibacillus barbaricus TaxID=182136 RepID=A0ABS2ZBJ2_9BACL|nr:helix-turn-helix domain-containing protein [Fictibacillus barbaricus]MBN3544100.1 hypothetical protein [Fictibacillus barbaricus]GGB68918.1 hypothetical protein GCM10007199_38880 [Fictibacillus barbaricus]
MNYEDIPDRLILNYKLLKVVIYEETKGLFEDRPHVLEHWHHDAYQMTEEETRQQAPCEKMRPSFRALFYLYTQTLFSGEHITKHMIRDAVDRYKDTIKLLLAGHFMQEFPNIEIKRSVNEEKIEEALDRDYIYSSMDMDFHLMRDIVTKKKEYKEGDTGYLATEIIDNKGQVRGMAELRPNETGVPQLTADQQEIWLELIESTLNSLDEMTADLFDLITYLWMVTPKDSDGYIEFHSNDALRLRNLRKRTANGRELDYREEDRFNIMKRVAALSSIWVSLGDQKIKVINAEEMQDNELYKFKDFQRMFEIGKIRVAYDKKTGEARGIYAVQVKPTSILTPYLEGPNRSIGLLDLKIFQYSHFTQREQKRLARYLNLQWKIRTVRRSLNQPFKVSTILKILDISSRYNGVQIRDKFENVLDELQKDDVIKTWHYTEEIDEEMVGRKGWFKNYWSKINVIILPHDSLVKENQKNLISSDHSVDERIIARMQKLTQDNLLIASHEDPTPSWEFVQQETASTIDTKQNIHILDKPEQQTFDFTPDIKLTPSSIKQMIDSLGMSIRQSASEIGIAHTTLSRYIRGENKRQNKNNDEKMLNWLKEKAVK